MKNIIAACALASAFLLQGCVAIETARSVAGTVNSARNATQAYHSYGAVKDLTQTAPLFQGYNSVLVLADLQPRDGAANVPVAFAGNMAFYTHSVARTVRAPVQVCQAMNQCYGRVMVVNFKEDAYDRNLLQKLTVGDKIRGKLTFTDASTGQIVTEKRVELAENYAGLARLTSGFIMTSMVKSFPSSTEADGRRVAQELERIPVVAPQYEPVLGRAS